MKYYQRISLKFTSEMSVEYKIKEQKVETNINPYSNTSVFSIFCLIFYEVL